MLVDGSGHVCTGLADGRVVRTTGPAPVEIVARVPGRPLGLEFHGEDELLVCASDAGLVAVSLAGGAVRTVVDRVDGRPVLACSDATVGVDGAIWFTDSSTRYPVPQSRTDLVPRTASGRLLRRDPDGRVTELLGGLPFAKRRRAGRRRLLRRRGRDGGVPAAPRLGRRAPGGERGGVRRRVQRTPGQHGARVRRIDLGRTAQRALPAAGRRPALWFGSLEGNSVATVPRPAQSAGAVP